MKSLVVAGLAMVWAAGASGATIGLYTDSTGTTCAAPLAVGERIYIQVWIEPDAPFDEGEFRVVGVPSGWTARALLPDESTAVFLIGGNLTGNGIYFTSSSAQVGRYRLINLELEATTAEANVVLEISSHAEPNPLPGTHPGCPWLHYGGPGMAEVCAVGGRFTINGEGDCFVAVQPVTWTGLRLLYR